MKKQVVKHLIDFFLKILAVSKDNSCEKVCKYWLKQTKKFFCLSIKKFDKINFVRYYIVYITTKGESNV